MSNQNRPLDPNEVLKHPERLRTLMSSPEVQKLAELLNQRSGGNLQAAAKSAQQGDRGTLQKMIEGLSATREGAQLIAQIQNKMNQ